MCPSYGSKRLSRVEIPRAIELLWESFSNLPTLRTLETIQELSDDDVRDQAIQLALEHDMPYASLAFFLDLKDWERAEELVFKQSHQLNGDYYYSLKPAAKFLECKAPLAASIIYSHRDYMQQLYNEHQRKRALWSLLADRDVFTVE